MNDNELEAFKATNGWGYFCIKWTAKIDADVMEQLNRFRIEHLGNKATISVTIDHLLKGGY